MLSEIVKYSPDFEGFRSSESLEIKSPYDGKIVFAVEQVDEKMVDLALSRSKECFEKVMRQMPAYRRAEILSKASVLINERSEDFARTIALEGGKPIKDARLEVSRAANTFSIASRLALSLDGEQIAMDSAPGAEKRLAMVLHEPIGVVGAVTPFNFPLNLVAHKVAPALAAGNTVVLKPSSQTPVSSFKLREVLLQAGLPGDALLVVPCRGARGSKLVEDRRLACLTFTGSPSVGWRLRQQVAPGTRVILELGGNAGIIVHEDACIDSAARAACRGGYAHAGQICISVQRVYVHESRYDEFLKRFTELVAELKVGNPLDDDTDVGPLIDSSAVEQTLEWVNEARSKGAKIVLGGGKLSDSLIEPVILTDTDPEMRVICEEVFGPVVSVMRYQTLDEAIDSLNDEHFGLQAGIFTQDIDTAFRAARSIDVGGVMINDAPTFRADHMPYGGRRESGLGLEGVKYALAEMTRPKFICLNLK